MINITLPDNSEKTFENNISGIDLANSIGKSLAKSAIAMELDGNLVDLDVIIKKDSKVRIITAKDPEGLKIIRHDAAHILAEAVKELYPDIQVTIGPAIENGFYYDFVKDKPFSEDDLTVIENKMYEIVKRDEKITKHIWTKDEAKEYYTKQKEFYKVEIIESLDENSEISFYKQGEFVDLCKGPHSPSTGKILAFKLLRVAGAYWRGDSNNIMLQRIYGTAWANKEDLKNYLTLLEEVAKRDHRKIGKELNLFHLQEEAPGMVFWHEKGWILYRIIENYIRNKILREGYIEVKTPIILDKSLWEKSGHWEKFGEAMFISKTEDRDMALKPMNCPCHVEIFNQGLRSYKELPIRMAEFGVCHRNEPSGSLHGIMRVRSFSQDDAHIFCTEDMITEETIKFCRLLHEVYEDFGFNEIIIKFSDRPEIRAGDDYIWDQAETSLIKAIETAGLKYILNPGEGAFYGPKLEFALKDAVGREWQCGTLQVDFILPQRLDAFYIGKDGNKYRPVMLHRAILGSIERFIGILIEQHAGKFPLWLAPIQVVVVTITNEANDYAQEIHKRLNIVNIRSKLDVSSEKINYKIRQYSLIKIPIILIVGKREMNEKTVSVRRIGSNLQEEIGLENIISDIINESKTPN